MIVDVLREWIPLVVALLDESERQRLAANVAPADWPSPTSVPGTAQLDHQQDLHKAVLEPKPTDGDLVENNYERAVRYLTDCGYLNARSRQAIVRAFEIDRTSQQVLEGTPGAGGLLISFVIDLQRTLDAGDKATEKLNQGKDSVFDQASDNGAFNEVVGSHSLMSKDTLTSAPLFDDARVLASVVSSSVLTIMLGKVSTPSADRRLVLGRRAAPPHPVPSRPRWLAVAGDPVFPAEREDRGLRGLPPTSPGWWTPRGARLSRNPRASRASASNWRSATSASKANCRATATPDPTAWCPIALDSRRVRSHARANA